MGFALTVQSGFSITLSATQTVPGLNPITQISSVQCTSVYANGTGNGNATRSYTVLLSIAAGANTTLNLQNLNDINTFNTPLNFTFVKGITAYALTPSQNAQLGANSTSMFIGNASSNCALTSNGAQTAFMNPFNGGFRIGFGGFASFSNPNGNCPVTNVSNLLKVTNEDAVNAAAVYISIFGIGV